MSAQIGLDDKSRTAVAGILNRLLGDEYVLLVKTKNYHWNVKGPSFSELHKLFDEQYEQLTGAVDEVAERIRSLDRTPTGTMAGFVRGATLKEDAGSPPKDKAMIKNLLKDHEQIIRTLRNDVEATGSKYGDMGTSDFLTGLMEEHEKTAWMLRSYE